MACLNTSTGEIKWVQKQIGTSSIAISEDGTQFAHFSIFDDISILAALIDTDSGEVISWAEYDASELKDFPSFIPSCLDAESKCAYLGYAGFLFKVDFDEETLLHMKLNDYLVQSVGCSDNRILAASSYRGDVAGKNQPYSFDGVSSKNSIEWNIEGTYDMNIVGARYNTIALNGTPAIAAFLNMNGPAAALTVGSKIQLVNIDDGEMLYTKEYPSTIVGVGTGYGGDEYDMVFVVSANGLLDLWTPYDIIDNGTSVQTALPCYISEASISWYEGRDALALLKQSSDSNSLMVYRLDLRPPYETIDISLDELIAMGREILSVHNGGEGNPEVVNMPQGNSEE